jgi:ABC-2 type transport system permease protein
MPATALTVALPPAQLRGGVASWAREYAAMTRWHLASLRLWLGALIAIQIMVGGGIVVAIGLFVQHLPPDATLILSTGVPVLNLIMVGLLLGPQVVADQKIQQSYDFMRTLPVPQTAAAAAWYTVCLIGGLPGAGLALAIAEARYGIPLAISPMIGPAVLLVAFTGTMLGYALGHASPSPVATRLLTQLLLFAIFGFTPVVFPSRQFPRWLDTLNWWLPFGHMADIVRADLTTGVVTTGIASSYVIVAVWGLASTLLAGWVLGRRR